MTERFHSEAADTHRGVGELCGFTCPSIEVAISGLADVPPVDATIGATADTRQP